MTDHREPAENTAPMLSAEPMESTDNADPMLPTESTDPTLPIESTDPRDAIDRKESSDRHDHFELPMGTACRHGVPDATKRDGSRPEQ